jgi:hypothetical protein
MSVGLGCAVMLHTVMLHNGNFFPPQSIRRNRFLRKDLRAKMR